MCPTGVGNDTVKLHKNQERFEVAERGECGCVERGEGVGIQTQGLFVGRRMFGVRWRVFPETAMPRDMRTNRAGHM